jgi:hypothetical protein
MVITGIMVIMHSYMVELTSRKQQVIQFRRRTSIINKRKVLIFH